MIVPTYVSPVVKPLLLFHLLSGYTVLVQAEGARLRPARRKWAALKTHQRAGCNVCSLSAKKDCFANAQPLPLALFSSPHLAGMCATAEGHCEARFASSMRLCHTPKVVAGMRVARANQLSSGLVSTSTPSIPLENSCSWLSYRVLYEYGTCKAENDRRNRPL